MASTAKYKPSSKKASQSSSKRRSADISPDSNFGELDYLSDRVAPMQKQMLLEWEAPTRPFRKVDKELMSTVLAGAFLIGVILFFIDGAMPVVALASLIFLLYVLGTVPPGKIIHTVTTWGIESERKLWSWDMLARYWIQGKKNNRMLIVETNLNWPRHVRFMLGDVDEDDLQELLNEHLVEDRPPANWLDVAGGWIEKKIRFNVDEK